MKDKSITLLSPIAGTVLSQMKLGGEYGYDYVDAIIIMELEQANFIVCHADYIECVALPIEEKSTLPLQNYWI